METIERVEMAAARFACGGVIQIVLNDFMHSPGKRPIHLD